MNMQYRWQGELGAGENSGRAAKESLNSSGGGAVGHGWRGFMQRLMLGADLIGRNACRHRLDALARARQQQTGAVQRQRAMAIGMADDRTQVINVLSKTRRHALRSPLTHSALQRAQRESSGQQTSMVYDTLRLAGC
jgi:hypothetical protein